MNWRTTVARWLVGPPPGERSPAMPTTMPKENPLESEEGEEARRNAALRMIDEDCYGFLLLTIHCDEHHGGWIELAGQVQPGWWPAVAETLKRIVVSAR